MIVEGHLGGRSGGTGRTTRGLRPPLSLAASPCGVPLTQGHHSSLMRQKYVYKPFVVSPLRQGSAQALRRGSGQASASLGLRTEPFDMAQDRPVEVTGPLRRNILKTLTIRLVQNERNL